MDDTRSPIILFDGECNLCASSVDFIIRHDPGAVFRFAAFQSQTGRELSLAHGIDPEQSGSILLIDSNGVRSRSDAALAIAERLDGPWRLLAVSRLLPHSWRDGVYDIVARNRYRWFGRQASCKVPTDDLRQRFLP